MNKYRIIYRSKTDIEGSSYEEWTDEFLRLPYIKADSMEEALAFAKWYTSELGNDVDKYEWSIFNYDDDLHEINKSAWYAYVNDAITLEEYLRIRKYIEVCIEDIER